MNDCEKCGGKGYIKVDSVLVESCECSKKHDFSMRFKNSGLPRKMANISIEDWNERQSSDGSDLSPTQIINKERALKVINDIYNNEKFPFFPSRIAGELYTSVIFCGPKNSGKSFATCILAKKAILKGAKVMYYDWFDLVTSLDRYDNREELDNILYNFTYCDLIIIDSVEKIDVNAQGRNQITRLLRKRINNSMWTLASLVDNGIDDIHIPGWKDLCEDSCVVKLL